ncbi:hypothetical protein [Bacillus sp. J37]|uniref:hypothetical protein n=1 Tax=Bacillus sp. J37 TaxID=935837 RepID=UPI00047D7DAC|nr:hypothetical protein [Bacillus sp. J37]
MNNQDKDIKEPEQELSRERFIHGYSTVGENGIKVNVYFTTDPEEDRKSREIIKEFIIKNIL